MEISANQSGTFANACKNIKMLLFDCDGVMTDGRVVLGNDANEFKFFSANDGIGINLWKRAGFSCGVISGRTAQALSQRARELKFDEVHQGSMTKGEVLKDIMQRHQLKADEIAYIGDDLNDLPIGTRVGIFFVPANHHYSIRPYATYVLRTHGGFGAVREAIDLMLEQKGLLQDLIKTFIEN